MITLHYFPGNASMTHHLLLRELGDELDAHLAGSGGPWMMGAQYSALDPYAFMLCRWTRGMARPARTLARIGPFLERMLTRPAVQSMLAAEGLKPPYV